MFEDSSVFPLKAASVDAAPPPLKEDVAQSAHLRTLGLCRISSFQASPPSSARPPLPPPPGAPPRQSQPGSLAWGRAASHRRRPSRRQRLRCFLCPLVLPSRRLLDVHVRSHRASGGFGCVRCSWKAESWEEMEPHWRSHSRRREEKRRRRQEERRAAEATALGSKTSAKQEVPQPTPDGYTPRRRRHNHSG